MAPRVSFLLVTVFVATLFTFSLSQTRNSHSGSSDAVKKPGLESVCALKKRAEAGDAKAQYELGRRYFNGRGVKKDHAEAARWIRKSTEHGNARAPCDLATP